MYVMVMCGVYGYGLIKIKSDSAAFCGFLCVWLSSAMLCGISMWE